MIEIDIDLVFFYLDYNTRQLTTTIFKRVYRSNLYLVIIKISNVEFLNIMFIMLTERFLWLNLNDFTEYFSCCKRTHLEEGAADRCKGFAKIESAADKARYKARLELVPVPPGHLLLFYERIVHEVRAVPAPARTIRLHLGWRVTESDEPLFGAATTLDWMEKQAVPLIKSGQKPRVFPTNYTNFPAGSNWRKEPMRPVNPINLIELAKWSQKTFHRNCLLYHRVNAGDFKGSQWLRVDASMKSLADYQLELHAPYEVAEKQLRFPQRWWVLYTFDSPHQRVFISLNDSE